MWTQPSPRGFAAFIVHNRACIDVFGTPHLLHADSARNRLVGIGFVSLTYVFFTLLDGNAKWLIRALPVIEVVWIRFVSHALLSAALLLPVHGLALARSKRMRMQIVRGLLMVSMTAINFTALQYLQLTVTSSIFFSVPIIIALLSVPLLGERMDARRWAAIVVGFCGVLVIVRPFGAGFHPAMILSVINAFIYAVFNMMTRRLAAYDPPETTQFLSALVPAVGLAPFALAVWVTPPDALHWTFMLLLGVFGGVGHYFLALAHRYASASTLAPFMYPQVLYMAIFGYVVFGDVPRWPVALGAAIVIGSGLYLLQRERERR
jgi:drug/metabolite transporter (DMT)-like permease